MSGAILGLSPALDEALKAEFSTWGPGKYDPRHHAFDGKNIIAVERPNAARTHPTCVWIAGGRFRDVYRRRLDLVLERYVVFADGRPGQLQRSPNRPHHHAKARSSHPKLPALLDYQLSLLAPHPPSGSFNSAAASRGERLFHGKAECATCHKPPTYTDVLSGPDPTVPLLHDRPKSAPSRFTQSEAQQEIPHVAITRHLAASSVLPRWQRGKPARSRQPL